MRRFLLVVFALSWIAVPAAAQDSLAEHSYKDAFRLAAPEDWEARQDVGPIPLMLAAPQEGPEDPFRENVNVTSETVGEELSLDAYFDRSYAEAAGTIQGFTEVETSNVRIGEVPAKRLVYEYAYRGHPVRVLAYVLIADGQGYFISGTALAEEYDAYADDFEQIAESFRAQ